MAYNRENIGVKMVERKMKWSGIYIAEEGGFFSFWREERCGITVYAMNCVKRIVVVGPSRSKWNLTLYPSTYLEL